MSVQSSSEGLAKKSWLITSLIVVVALGLVWAIFFRKGSDEKIVYRPVKVERGDIQTTVIATGTVAPENRLEIKPPIAGRIEKVLVDEGAHVKKGQILAWMSSTERAAMLDAARGKGPEELAKWEDLYKATPIIAPIKGMIILRNVEEGQTFANTDSVFSMSDRLTVKAQVDETDISQIHLNQVATITLDAYPDQSIDAIVDQVAFDAKTVNNVTTYVADVLPKETPEFMRSGMTANVNFVLKQAKNVLMVPTEAVRVDGANSYVKVREHEGDQPTERSIKTGINDGKNTEVVSGLNEGDRVVITRIITKKSDTGNPFSPMRNLKGGQHKAGGH